MNRYIKFNPNPDRKSVGDCVIRAICCVTGYDWEHVYDLLSDKGREIHDMPSSNEVWGSVLKDLGFRRKSIPNNCPDCYTVNDFCEDHQMGAYILATGTHAVACFGGNYYDNWDSGDEVPMYYFEEV